MSLLTDMEDVLAPEKDASGAMFLVESESTSGILLFQILDGSWMCFLSKSYRGVNLEIPSWYRRKIDVTELIFMLLEDFNHPLKS